MTEYDVIVAGIGAILSPTTGIVDYGAVAGAMARRFEEFGGEMRTAAEVQALEDFVKRRRIRRGDRAAHGRADRGV